MMIRLNFLSILSESVGTLCNGTDQEDPAQVLGCSNTNTVRSSRRPSHISIVEANIDNGLKSDQVEAAVSGPKEPNAGPVLPSKEIETEATSVSVKSGSRKEMVNIEAVTNTIHELTIPRIIQIRLSSTTF